MHFFLKKIFRNDKERTNILASSVASPKPGNLMTPVRIQVLFFRKGITPSWMHSWLEIYTYLRKAIPFPHLFFPDFFGKEKPTKNCGHFCWCTWGLVIQPMLGIFFTAKVHVVPFPGSKFALARSSSKTALASDAETPRVEPEKWAQIFEGWRGELCKTGLVIWKKTSMNRKLDGWCFQIMCTT